MQSPAWNNRWCAFRIVLFAGKPFWDNSRPKALTRNNYLLISQRLSLAARWTQLVYFGGNSSFF
jgi:hypothetical protein